MINQETIKKIELKMLDAKRHFGTYKLHMAQAEKLIKRGMRQSNPNNVYMQNALNILASFISNTNVREMVKMIQKIMKGQSNG